MSKRRRTLGPRIALSLALILAAVTSMSGAASAAEVAVEFDPSYRYAINLVSLREPVDPSTLPRLEVFDKYLVYTTRIRKDGLDWHRLRIGFFPTKEAAAKVMSSLHKEFPEAWVTKVSAGERTRSKNYAIIPRAAALEAPAAVSQPEKEEVRETVPPSRPPSQESPSSFIAEAERAMVVRDYSRAINLYIEVLKRPDTGLHGEAQEYLGLAYEREGNLSQARAEYRTYLILYPEGKGAERVRRRLAEFKAAGVEPGEKLEEEVEKERVEKERVEKEKPKEEGAEKEGIEGKEGFFLGVGVTRAAIGGDFNGTKSVSGGGSTEVVPGVFEAIGFKLMAGYQLNRGSIEFNYSQSDHDADWLGMDRPTAFRSYSLDGKLFVFKEYYRLQPLLALGGGYNTLTVESGSTDGVTTEDATFKGMDLRFGGGFEILLHRRVAVDLLAIYRWGFYNSVDGIASKSISGIDGNGLTASVETKFIF